jgi:uncharacterized circularly permuted ATP-grasp superfamily protein/uncharacterized alpha-E superfamily protein
VNAYDEMVTGNGEIRPHWRNLLATVWTLPAEQLAEKQARASAQIADSDESVAVQGPGTSRHAWSLDMLPLLIPGPEWRIIATGLKQRVRLLDTILADLYGPQSLIREQLLPPYLVLGNPAFLRPLRNVVPVGGAPHLHFYAADLVRLASGEWRVFADRTQAAAGVGYALRNRSVMARTFPEAFRAAQVRRLDSFVDEWRASLHRVGNTMAVAPQIVLLTPGPYNSAYFEHVSLARELGATLVQSADLTVRGNIVYLKTLDGLVRVNVIYRRVDGDYCDPLELREESELGVAGLIEAMRAGNVAVLNMPGSAVIETPAFTPFLPELARRLLGQELLLPAVTTWWCGQERALAEVRAALDSFVLQPVFNLDAQPIEPASLSSEDRETFEADLLRAPESFVARERMSPSLAPCLGQSGGKGAMPRPVVLRVALVWNGTDWAVLPGGVARLAEGPSIYGSTLYQGGLAKDVWVLADDEPVPQAGASADLPQMQFQFQAQSQMDANLDEAALRSRTADDLFWLGRYIERLDSGVRHFQATLLRLARGGLSAHDRAELRQLAIALKQSGWISSAVATAPVDGMMFLDGVMDAASGGLALRDCRNAVHRLTLVARDQLSLDMWHTLHRLTGSDSSRNRRELDRLLESLDGTIRTIATFSGLIAENMPRGAGWRFLDFGRRVERSLVIARAVHAVTGMAGQIEDGLRLSLELCDSMNAYRMRYPAETRFSRALRFILADASNPRGLLYQLDQIDGHLSALAPVGGMSIEPGRIGALIEAVVGFPSLIIDPEQRHIDIWPLLDRVSGDLSELSNAVTKVFFSHVAAVRRLGPASTPAVMEAVS